MEVEGQVWMRKEDDSSSTGTRMGGVVEYEDWGGRGFNLVKADCGPSRGPACPEGGLGRSGWFSPGGRHRGVVGTLFCSVDARSSTEDSVVVTTLYAFNINLANSSPPAGLCNCDQCVLSTPEPGVKSADA